DVILFDPSDADFPIGFNILQANSELEKTLLSSDLIATFRRFSSSWGDVMDSVLANAILAVVESADGGTLFDLKRFLVEKDFRERFLESTKDESIRYFWKHEFPLLRGKPQSSILIRLDTFLRQRLIRNIVCQKKSKLDFRSIMDNHKILLIKLSQGAIGEENSHLLGSLMVSKLHQIALSRQDSHHRPFFSVYMDEFHNFITPSMESILSGVRKYNIGLVLAHQEFRQLLSRDQNVASSVLSNCYTRICFRLAETDSERLAKGFTFFEGKSFQNLGVGEAIVRIERADYDFNLKTALAQGIEAPESTRRVEEVLTASRDTYATSRHQVESELARVFQPASSNTAKEKRATIKGSSDKVEEKKKSQKQRNESPESAATPFPDSGNGQH
ncbi:MAG: TraM recognition domain-containing protein, partial [Flavobacteriales bacterium]|nr:TraM recognition domain-containing protein [Flavobacteriales bacterium]